MQVDCTSAPTATATAATSTAHTPLNTAQPQPPQLAQPPPIPPHGANMASTQHPPQQWAPPLTPPHTATQQAPPVTCQPQYGYSGFGTARYAPPYDPTTDPWNSPPATTQPPPTHRARQPPRRPPHTPATLPNTATTPTDPDTAQHYQYQTTPTTADIKNAVHTAKPAAVLAEPRAPQSTPTKPKAQAEQT